MIYADYNATTPMLPEVLELLVTMERENWGNASSIYQHGREARAALERARGSLATLLGAQPGMVLFTSGGSESNNWVLACSHLNNRTRHIVTTTVEHASLLKPAKRLANQGVKVTFVPVDAQGALDEDAYGRALKDSPTLVSIMGANNETGVLFPVRRLAIMAKEAGALVHCDASQCIGKIPMHFLEDQLDFMTISSHKFYGPKGVGALLTHDRSLIENFSLGGGQEYGMRPGTEHVAAICAMVKALQTLGTPAYGQRISGIQVHRDKFEAELKRRFDRVTIHGAQQLRLPNTSNVCFGNIDAQSLMMNLDLGEVACSSGSACHSGSVEPSHVLAAMGCCDVEANATLRFSFGLQTDALAVEHILGILSEAMPRLLEERNA